MGLFVCLSPAKTLDYKSPILIPDHSITQPVFCDKAFDLAKKMSLLSVDELMGLMGVSRAIAEVNQGRFKDFLRHRELKAYRPALAAFKGDVYKSLHVVDFNHEDWLFAQNTLRIFSGLYGVLRPYDAMQPYRLEMGSILKDLVEGGGSMARFWQKHVTEFLAHEAAYSSVSCIVNLASNEYAQVVDWDSFAVPIYHVQFRELYEGGSRVVGILAKKARGAMARFIIKERITSCADIPLFAELGYKIDLEKSVDRNLVFVR